MKVTFFTAVLSSIIATSPLYATELTPSKPATVTKSVASVPLINLNTADVSILAKSMKGIGVKRAEAIVQYREKNDKFKLLDELAFVPGIGKNFVKNHYEQLQKTFTVK